MSAAEEVRRATLVRFEPWPENVTDDQLARMCALGFDVRELSRPKLKWWVRPILALGEISRRIRRTWSRMRR